ncbi:hypothetical protein G7Y79_00021g050200 [Physcia stellaris]|nr:hypothetical protein G7Y79_00021g050200 [Physcia stellaris]
MITDLKNLYEGKPDRRGRSTWVDKYLDDIEEAAEHAETACYALIVRNKKCYDSRKQLEMDSIIVQSPLLKVALGQILKDYPGITTTLDRLTFEAPFKPFIHRWSKLVDVLKNEKNEETKEHLNLLYRTMEAELKDDLKARDDYVLNKQDCAFRLKSGSYVETRCGNAFALDCEKVDWDGENFGLASTRLLIFTFQGTTPITKLSAFPLEYHRDLTRNSLKEVEHLNGFQATVTNTTMELPSWGPVKYNVDSRIMIDTYAWNRFNPNRQVSLSGLGKPMNADSYNDDAEDYDDDGEYTDCGDDDYHDGDLQPGEPNTQVSLTKDQLLLVNEIKWNEPDFDSLVLPSDPKALILALTESQRNLLQGKGKGMILLLQASNRRGRSGELIHDERGRSRGGDEQPVQRHPS